jgi:peptidoglycan DL-endopeptidase CwlO
MGWFRVGGPRLLGAAMAVAVAAGLGATSLPRVALGDPGTSTTSTTVSSSATSTSTTLPSLPAVPASDTDGQPAAKLLSTAIALAGLGVDNLALAAAVSATQAKLEADAEISRRAQAQADVAAQAAATARTDAAAAESSYVDMQASVRQAVVYLYTTGSDQLAMNPSAGPLLAYAEDYAESTLSPYGVLDQRKAVEQEMEQANRAARDASARQRDAAAKAAAAQSDEQRQLQALESELSSTSASATAAAITADHVTLADQAGQEIADAGALEFAPKTPVPAPLSTTNVAMTWAFAELGKQYVWGATGPATFDCSGLTQYVWKAAGVSIPRVAADQDAWAVPVPLSDLLPGDLVFFGTQDIHHVGIYIGGGLMINAPHTGTVVQVSSIWWSDLAGFGRVHDPKTPVPPHMPPSVGQPAPVAVVPGAGPVPSQTKPPVGWKPLPGSTTPIDIIGAPGMATTTSSTTSSTSLDSTSSTTPAPDGSSPVSLPDPLATTTTVVDSTSSTTTSTTSTTSTTTTTTTTSPPPAP